MGKSPFEKLDEFTNSGIEPELTRKVLRGNETKTFPHPQHCTNTIEDTSLFLHSKLHHRVSCSALCKEENVATNSRSAVVRQVLEQPEAMEPAAQRLRRCLSRKIVYLFRSSCGSRHKRANSMSFTQRSVTRSLQNPKNGYRMACLAAEW